MMNWRLGVCLEKLVVTIVREVDSRELESEI
jgi:hypothetical protein